MDKPTNTNSTLPANQTHPHASGTNWSAIREWSVCAPLKPEEKDAKCHFNILAFDCGHSIPHPHLPHISHISHISGCKYTVTQYRLGCANMGPPAFITSSGACDACTKSKLHLHLARSYVEIITMNQSPPTYTQMQEFSRRLNKEKSLPQVHVEGGGASKKPLETKRMLPSRFNGQKVVDGGHLAPPVNLATKPKMMSANMRQKLSEHKKVGSSDEVEDGDWVFVNAE